ncbi:MAG: DUF808 domain-containing protein [Candidatus Adiutrix sp.]|jgi:predicted DNA repair protein MutK|nr:DUF808 domain-containing protein [Candidatus Adiutrix sp.]
MAGFSLLALLDDITTLLDDVALMTKVAAKKTAGVLGDDLALNARQVSGVAAERELPVVWAVAKGSLVNKVILIPAALLISYLAPGLIRPLLMLGGLYLSYEGAEKIFHCFAHPGPGSEMAESAAQIEVDLPALEKMRIKGAVRTDFILSAEIVVIAMGSVAEVALAQRAVVLALVGVLMTAGVYGLVAAIVKLDDLGFWLLRRSCGLGLFGWLGAGLTRAAPWLMRFLTVAGTAAMFLVGGSILTHGLGFFDHLYEALAAWPVSWLWPHLIDAGCGLAAGAVFLVIWNAGRKLPKCGWNKWRPRRR